MTNYITQQHLGLQRHKIQTTVSTQVVSVLQVCNIFVVHTTEDPVLFVDALPT